MKKLFFLIFGLLCVMSVSAQTNTMVNSGDWNTASNWSLGIAPFGTQDVVIPSGFTVNVNAVAGANSIELQGTAVMTLNSTLGLLSESTFGPNSTVNWSSGTLNTGATINAQGTILLSGTGLKYIQSGTLSNSGEIILGGSGELYLNSIASLTNELVGVIDFQTDSGNISYTGSPPHLFTNHGTIIRSVSTGDASIDCPLVNDGIINVQTGTLTIGNAGNAFNGGVYNVSSGAILNWNLTIAQTGTLTGAINGTLNMNGTVTIPESASANWNFTGPGAINWTNGTIAGPGTLNNNSTITLTTTALKYLTTGLTFNNNGTMLLEGSGDFYLNASVLNNSASGVINMQTESANISYTGGLPRTLNNYGTISTTMETGISTIFCELQNYGTLDVESGTLTLDNANITFNGGIYNISSGATMHLISSLSNTGTLSGTIDGTLSLEGNLVVPDSATWNFTGSGDFNWKSGTIHGPGTLNNNSVVNLTTTGLKYLNTGLTLNNTSTWNLIGTGDLYTTDVVFNNLPSGLIDIQDDSSNISYTGAGSRILNNTGTIRKSGASGESSISCELKNTGVLEVLAGTLELSNTNIELTGGTYNVAAGQFLELNSLTLTGTLAGNLAGEVLWNAALTVPLSQSATFDFSTSGSGGVNMVSGNLTGGGTLNNQSFMKLTTTALKYVYGNTTFNNESLINFDGSGDFYISNGIVNNLPTGTIDLRTDSSNISYTDSGSRVLNNTGVIKKTTTTGVTSIVAELNNSGTLSIEAGTLSIENPNIQFNGGTYNVTSGAHLQLTSTITMTGSLMGVVEGTIDWTNTLSVPTSASFDFTGSGSVEWTNGQLNGGGNLTNNFLINVPETALKYIYGATTLTNAATLDIVGSGDLYVVDGTIDNASTGVLDLSTESGNISMTGSGTRLLNNSGILRRSSANSAFIDIPLNNYGIIEAQAGVLGLSGAVPFTNHANATMTGIATIVLPTAANFTNNGNVSPGGNPGILNLTGAFESESSSTFNVDIAGLTPGTGHDQLAISGAAVMNGNVEVNLQFAPSVNDEFIIATTGGLITTCGLQTETTATHDGLLYTFSVGCEDENKVILTVIEIVAAPPTADDQTFCLGATVADLVAEGENIQWYADAVGGSPLDPSTLLASGSYYVTQTVNGFESERVAVVVTVISTPEPTAASPQNFVGSATVADLVATGTDIQWYADAVGGTALDPSTVLSTGTYYVTQLIDDCESTRKPISVTVSTEFPFYVDGDNDGFGAGNLVNVPAEGPNDPPAGYSLDGTDCDDTDELVWQSGQLYVDADGDGYDNGLETVCYGAEIPAGYASLTLGADCDDSNDQVWQGTLFYVDADGDSFGSDTQELVCASAPPAGYATNNTDCDDTNELVWQSGQLYVDADGDGYDNGLETVCYGAEIPAGYASLTLGADCNDADENVNPDATEIPGNGIDENCNGNADDDDGSGEIISYVLPGFCGTTLSGINTTIGIYSYPGATAYRIRAINQATLQQTELVRTVPHFKISMFPAYAYAATYSISVEVQLAGVWSGYFGPGCVISTPQILAENGPGQITPAQCGITLATMNTLIATTSLAGVTGYRFKVTDTGTLVSQTIDRPLHWFSLPMLANFRYGTSYQVEVAFRTNGDYTAFGFPCTVSTPAVPTLKECGKTIASVNENIQTVSLQHVTKYRFKIEGPGVDLTVENSLNYFTFNQVPGFTPGGVYSVSVSVLTTGIWSPYGNTCTVTAPAAARNITKEPLTNFNVKAWPNPFSGAATLGFFDAGTSPVSVKVFDMTGKLLDAFEVATGIDTLTLGDRYPAGVYTVSATCQSVSRTLRIVKR